MADLTIPCPYDMPYRGSGIGGQTLTSCPLCQSVSANTAMSNHRPIAVRELARRLEIGNEMTQLFSPDVDAVGKYLEMERAIKILTGERDRARDTAIRAGAFEPDTLRAAAQRVVDAQEARGKSLGSVDEFYAAMDALTLVVTPTPEGDDGH